MSTSHTTSSPVPIPVAKAINVFVAPPTLSTKDVSALPSPTDWMHAFPGSTTGSIEDTSSEETADDDDTEDLFQTYHFSRIHARRPSFTYSIGEMECDSIAGAVDALMQFQDGEALLKQVVEVKVPRVVVTHVDDDAVGCGGGVGFRSLPRGRGARRREKEEEEEGDEVEVKDGNGGKRACSVPAGGECTGKSIGGDGEERRGRFLVRKL